MHIDAKFPSNFSLSDEIVRAYADLELTYLQFGA